ncbi:MAG TPA: ATP-binding protein [Verrucomicrobiae bacterium]
MNNNDENPNPMPIFHGSSQRASYAEQLVERYKGNPLIEALPPIRSPQEAAQIMSYYPERQPNSHRLPPEIRMHLIMDAVHFIQPFPVHIDLEQRISRVIRDPYTGRNPMARDHWQDLDQRVDTIIRAGGIPLRSSNVIGFSVIGLPGVGKTTGVERVLQTYPQVIHHQSYKGQPFCRTQLVWLKLTCPHDGSIKGLCLDFFKDVDSLLGTHHSRDYAYTGKRPRTVDELIPGMCRVGWIHCLGLLVVDELQHLNQANSGGEKRMLNFFLQLMNNLGVPVILIGTNAAMEILTRELRQIRRSCGQGDLVWDRMANDEVWRLFVESLWRYEFTKLQTPLSQDLSDVLFEESAGIVDFAVKLFLLAQVRAISTGIEKITTAIIRSVAKDSLRLAQPALSAIRTGDMRAVAGMTDLHPIDFESAVQQIRKKALLQQLSPGSQVASDINKGAVQPTTPLPDAVAPTVESMNSAHPASERTNVKRQRKKMAGQSKCLLSQVAAAGLSKGQSAHSALSAAGLIKPLSEFNGSPSPA